MRNIINPLIETEKSENKRMICTTVILDSGIHKMIQLQSPIFCNLIFFGSYSQAHIFFSVL